MKNKINIKENQIISKIIYQNEELNLSLFSFDKDESISEQSNSQDIFIFVLEGKVNISINNKVKIAHKDQLLAIEKDVIHQVYSSENSKLLQLSINTNKGENMEKFIKKINTNEVLNLKDTISYEENGVSSISLVQRTNFTMTLMAFSKGSKIASHSSNGDALVQILDGSAKITVDNKEYIVNAEESLLMPAGIPHSLSAENEFKMLLIVVKAEGKNSINIF